MEIPLKTEAPAREIFVIVGIKFGVTENTSVVAVFENELRPVIFRVSNRGASKFDVFVLDSRTDRKKPV